MSQFSGRGERFLREKYAEWFALLDVDRDGSLSSEDFSRLGTWMSTHLDHAPGRATAVREALLAFWDAFRASADENGDGWVSYAEFEGYYLSLASDLRAGRALPAYAVEPVRRLFNALDHDGDGAISLREYTIYLESLRSPADPRLAFARLDLDGDGSVSVAELEEHFVTWVSSARFDEPGNVLMTGTVPPVVD
jgi:Ca2+-binding EF-hand superfamily protein